MDEMRKKENEKNMKIMITFANYRNIIKKNRRIRNNLF